jgi:hypothetical protein
VLQKGKQFLVHQFNHSLHDTNSYGTQDKDKQNKNTTQHVLDTTMRKQTYVYNMCINNWFICRNKRQIKRIKTYYLELMLSLIRARCTTLCDKVCQ